MACVHFNFPAGYKVSSNASASHGPVEVVVGGIGRGDGLDPEEGGSNDLRVPMQ